MSRRWFARSGSWAASRRWFTRTSVRDAAASLLAALMVAGLIAGGSTSRSAPRSAHTHATAPSSTSAPPPQLVPPPAVLSAPSGVPAGPATNLARLVIPSIGVNAAIEDVGLDNAGSMGVPVSPADVGWFSPGPWPGQAGDAVIDGHLDWYGVPAVFWELDALKPGDTLELSRDGQTSTFRVTRVNAYALNQEPAYLFGATGAPLLSLITCAGAWDSSHQIYDQRLVVDAAPV